MKEGGGVLPISFFWLLRNQLSQLVSFLAAEDARRVTHCLKMGTCSFLYNGRGEGGKKEEIPSSNQKRHFDTLQNFLEVCTNLLTY